MIPGSRSRARRRTLAPFGASCGRCCPGHRAPPPPTPSGERCRSHLSPSTSRAGGAFRRGRLLVAAAAGSRPDRVLLAPAAQRRAPPRPPRPPRRPYHGDVREVKPGTKFSTKKLDLESRSRNQRRPSSGPTAPATPAVGTTRTLLALDDYNGDLLPQGVHAAGGRRQDRGVGGRRHRPSRPATAATQVADSHHGHRGPGAGAGRPVRHQHVPEGVAGLQRRARPGRQRQRRSTGVDPTGDGDKIMTLVDNVRDDNYYEGVERGPDLHRRLLLLASSTSCSTATS